MVDGILCRLGKVRLDSCGNLEISGMTERR